MAGKENTLPVEITTPVVAPDAAANGLTTLTEAELDAVSGGGLEGSGGNGGRGGHGGDFW